MAERTQWIQGASYSAEDDRQHWAGLLTPSALAGLFPKSGVLARYGAELAVSAQGTPNMTVNVGTGRAVVAGTSGASQGGYIYVNDATKVMTVTAADGTNPRKDIIYVQIEDAAYAGAVNAGTIKYLAGTPAASPVAPALPASSLLLATITLPAGAGGATVTNAMIADGRSYTGLSGRFYSSAPSDVGSIVNGFSGQTGDLHQWKAAPGGSALARISAAGAGFFAAGSQVGGSQIRVAADDPNITTGFVYMTYDHGYRLDSAWDGTRWLIRGYTVAGAFHANARVDRADSAGTADNANALGGVGPGGYAGSGHGHGYVDPAGAYTMTNTFPFTMPNLSIGSTFTCTFSSGLVMQRTSSSERYKKDVVDFEYDPEVLKKLRPVVFRYDNDVEEVHDDGRLRGGFIAERVNEVFPLSVVEVDGVIEDIDDRTLIAMAIAGIQDLYRLVDSK